MAASDYIDTIQNLYIAYFGRPADPAGLAFWTEQVNAAGGNLSGAIAGFATSNESGVLYAGVSLSAKVSAIYQNLFNRAPEPTGLAYWVGKIGSGEISDAQAAYEILTAAGPGDASAIANKLSVAKAFTAALDTPAEIAGYTGGSAALAARTFLSKVDSTSYMLNQATSSLTTTVAQVTGTQTSTPAPAPAPAAFTASVDANTHAVTFGGSATGDITLSWAGNDATFARGGSTASAVTFGGQGATSITLASDQTLASSATDLNLLSNYIPNGGSLSIGGTGTVKLSDTTLSASRVNALDSHIDPKLDLTSATTLTGNLADINTVKLANGNSLDITTTLNLTLTDTALNLSSGKIAVNATGSHDSLTVTDAPSSMLNMSVLSGFETITLNGSTAQIIVADGAGTKVSSSKAVQVQLGSGGQTFTGSSGNDVVTVTSEGNTLTGGAGNNTFQFSLSQFKSGNVLSLVSNANTITDWSASLNNTIDFAANLTTTDHVAAASPGTASISNGLATFHASDTSLASKVTAVVNAVGTDAVGTAVTFVSGADSYLFVVGDATAGVQAGDALIKLTGGQANGIGLINGDVTSLVLA